MLEYIVEIASSYFMDGSKHFLTRIYGLGHIQTTKIVQA